MTEEEMWKQVMDGVAAWEKEINDHNIAVLKEIGMTDFRDFYEMVGDYTTITDKVSIVESPSGVSNNEDFGFFTNIHVDQYSVGDSGDSYAGFIYGKFADNKWLRVPYEC